MRRLSATSQRLEEAIKDAVALSKTRRPSLTRWEEPLNLPASFSRADLRARGIDRFVIHPDSYLKAVIELFMIICVLYTAFVEVLKVTYLLKELHPEIDVTLDVVFGLDILFQFFCGYHDSGGKRFPVLIFKMAVQNYVKTWFTIDLLAAIPFDRFLTTSGRNDGAKWLGVVKTVRLFKLGRIMRRWDSLSFAPLLKVLTSLFMWTLAAHWVACGFFIIGWSTCRSLYNETWITLYWPQMRDTCKAGLPPDPSLVTDQPNPLSLLGVHLRTCYWAMATMSSMGYGDSPRASTDLEYFYSILAQVLGACIAAAIFSNIGQLINKQDGATARYQAQLDKVRELVRLFKLPNRMRAKLLGYHELLFAVSRGYDTNAIAAMFPLGVQEEIFADMHVRALRRMPMFHLAACDESFFKTMVRMLRVNVLLDGDFIFKEGELGDRMYFIKTGYLQIGNATGVIVYASKGPGSFFGEFAMFSTTFRRNGSAWALTDCILFTLTNADFQAVLARFDDHGEVYEQMRAIAFAQRSSQKKTNIRAKSKEIPGSDRVCSMFSRTGQVAPHPAITSHASQVSRRVPTSEGSTQVEYISDAETAKAAAAAAAAPFTAIASGLKSGLAIDVHPRRSSTESTELDVLLNGSSPDTSFVQLNASRIDEPQSSGSSRNGHTTELA